MKTTLDEMTADSDGHTFRANVSITDGFESYLCRPLDLKSTIWPNGKYAYVIYDFTTRVELARATLTLGRSDLPG
jgi:hypothetical protein